MKTCKSFFRRHISQKIPLLNSSGSYKLPTYQHDQCERSLHMHLFTLEKKDITLLLILAIAFSVFCMLVASFAPKSHVLDTLLLSRPMVQSREHQARLNQPYYSVLDDSHGDLGQSDESIEMRMMTKPLNTLNRAMTFLIKSEFDLKLDNIEQLNPPSNGSNYDKSAQFVIKGSYHFEWELGASRDSATINCENKDRNCQRELNKDASDKKIRREEGEEYELKSKTTNNLKVLFFCIRTNLSESNLKTKPDQSAGEKNLDRVVNCRTPDLSFVRRIADLRRNRYQIIMRISDVKFLAQRRSAEKAHKDGIEVIETILDQRQLTASSVRLAVTMSYTNSSFTFLTIFIHLFFLLISLCVACCFILCLTKYSLRQWSLEQKWTSLLLVLLIGANS